MGVSVAKVRANRRHVARATGPCTAEGKVLASLNALKHGLAARKDWRLPGESEAGDPPLPDTHDQPHHPFLHEPGTPQARRQKKLRKRTQHEFLFLSNKFDSFPGREVN